MNVRQIGAAILAVVILFVAAANFGRLQARINAPSVGEMFLYALIPSALGLGVLYLSFHLATPVAGQAARPGRGPTAETNPPADRPDVNRLRIWSILDELSEALRSDNEGSEAMYVARERYHRIQFAPTDDEPPKK